MSTEQAPQTTVRHEYMSPVEIKVDTLSGSTTLALQLLKSAEFKLDHSKKLDTYWIKKRLQSFLDPKTALLCKVTRSDGKAFIGPFRKANGHPAPRAVQVTYVSVYGNDVFGRGKSGVYRPKTRSGKHGIGITRARIPEWVDAVRYTFVYHNLSVNKAAEEERPSLYIPEVEVEMDIRP